MLERWRWRADRRSCVDEALYRIGSCARARDRATAPAQIAAAAALDADGWLRCHCVVRRCGRRRRQLAGAAAAAHAERAVSQRRRSRRPACDAVARRRSPIVSDAMSADCDAGTASARDRLARASASDAVRRLPMRRRSGRRMRSATRALRRVGARLRSRAIARLERHEQSPHSASVRPCALDRSAGRQVGRVVRLAGCARFKPTATRHAAPRRDQAEPRAPGCGGRCGDSLPLSRCCASPPRCR